MSYKNELLQTFDSRTKDNYDLCLECKYDINCVHKKGWRSDRYILIDCFAYRKSD